MRTIAYCKTIALLIAATALAADDPGGWSKAKWGMTDDELVKAFDGQVVRFAKVDPFQHASVGIESIEVSGVQFKVYMAPIDGKLDHILFASVNQTDNTEETFQLLQNLLVQKYGRPWKSDAAGSVELQWTFPTTVVQLSKIKLPSVSPHDPPTFFVHILYKKRPPNPL